MRTPAPGSGWGLPAGHAPDAGHSVAQCLAGFPVAVAVEIGVPQVRQLLGAGCGIGMVLRGSASGRRPV
jgi:hypothetical protein